MLIISNYMGRTGWRGKDRSHWKCYVSVYCGTSLFPICSLFLIIWAVPDGGAKIGAIGNVMCRAVMQRMLCHFILTPQHTSEATQLLVLV
jgi:hypothetical protein